MSIEKFADSILGDEMYHTELSHGTQAYFLPHDSSIKVIMCHLFTRFGSIDARFKDASGKIVEIEDGTAHFLEHSAFYDPNGKHALLELTCRGAYANAWTNFDQTTYYFHNAGRNTKNYLEYLISFVTTPYLTDEVVKKEQGVIAEEVAMYKDKPGSALWENLRLALFRQHPVQRSIGGNRESILKITKDYLQYAYDTFYHPSNLSLVIFAPSSGGLKDAKKYFAMAEQICQKKGFVKKKAPEYIYVNEPAEVNQKRIMLAHQVPEPLIAMGFKAAMGIEGSPYERLKADLINELLSSTIFSDSSEAIFNLVQAGVARGIHGNHNSGRGFGYFAVNGSAENAERFEEEVMKMLKAEANGGLSKERFERQKYSMKNRLVQYHELEDPSDYEHQIVPMLAAGFNPMDMMPALQEITYEDALEAGKKYLDTENYAVSVIMPK